MDEGDPGGGLAGGRGRAVWVGSRQSSVVSRQMSDTRAYIKFNPKGAHGRETSLTAAFAPVVPAGATMCVVQALAQNVRFTLDGTTPTAAVGFQIAAGDRQRILPA